MRINFDNISNDDSRLRDQAISAYSEHNLRMANSSRSIAAPAGIKLDLGSNRSLPIRQENTQEISKDAKNALSQFQNQQDFLTVMGSMASDEDFGRMLKEGASPADTDLTETVTNLDRIKLAVAKGGTRVAGFNDDMEVDKLAEMTGSQVFAQSLASAFQDADLPLTGENTEASAKAYQELSNMPAGSIPDNAAAYLVQNGDAPTVDNIYKALHSGQLTGRGGESFYRDAAGYVGKTGGSDLAGLEAQIDKTIEEADLPVNEETRAEAAFLLEENIPLTPESLNLLQEIRQVQIPDAGKEEALAKAVAAAVSEGKTPGDAIFGETETVYEKALRIDEEYHAIDPEAFAKDPEKFGFAKTRLVSGEKQYSELEAKLALTNVQLKMTAQANLQLIKSGYSIETAPLAELAEKLQQAKRELYPGLSDPRIEEYEETLKTTEEMPSWPAAVAAFGLKGAAVSQVSVEAGVGAISAGEASGVWSFSLQTISVSANSMAARYRQAGEAYETLWTAPRADLGDSIRKAFQNVDEILSDNGYEATEELRRAVRILGYNSMEISPENIEKVREADAGLQSVMRELTPSKALELIRDGVNPLEISLTELSAKLSGDGSRDGASERNEKEEKSFAKFLYKLEKKKEISTAERSSFMGIYRLLNQLERDDGAALGSLLRADAEVSFDNLLTAMRSASKKGMSYEVNDTFGGVNAADTGTEAIDAQIGKAFEEELPDVKSLERFAQVYRETAQDEASELEQLKEETNNARDVIARNMTEEGSDLIRMLRDLELPASPANLEACELLMKGGEFYRALQKFTGTAEIKGVRLEHLADAAEAGEEATAVVDGAEKELDEAEEAKTRDQENPLSYEETKELSLFRNALSITARAVKNEEYHIPVETENGIMAVNVRFLKGDGQGSISITAESPRFGNVAAGLSVSAEGNVTGSVETDSREALTQLKEVIGKWSGENAVEVSFAAHPKAGSISETEGREAADNKTLYGIAKSFLEVIG